MLVDDREIPRSQVLSLDGSHYGACRVRHLETDLPEHVLLHYLPDGTPRPVLDLETRLEDLRGSRDGEDLRSARVDDRQPMPQELIEVGREAHDLPDLALTMLLDATEDR